MAAERERVELAVTETSLHDMEAGLNSDKIRRLLDAGFRPLTGVYVEDRRPIVRWVFVREPTSPAGLTRRDLFEAALLGAGVAGALVGLVGALLRFA